MSQIELCMNCRWTPCTHDDSSWCTIDCTPPHKLRKLLVEKEKEISWLKAWRLVARKWWGSRPEALKKLTEKLAEKETEIEEQARLLGMSGSREAKLLADIEQVKFEMAAKLSAYQALGAFNESREKGKDLLALHLGWKEKEKEYQAEIKGLREGVPSYHHLACTAKIQQQADRIHYLKCQALADQKEASEQAEIIRMGREILEKVKDFAVDEKDHYIVELVNNVLDKMNQIGEK